MISLLVLSGCALQGVQYPSPDLALPGQVLLRDVPFFAQKAYQCGPAALAMVLQQTGATVTPDELVPMVYVPDRKGSLQSGLISGARRQGRIAYPIQGLSCLIQEVAADHPVIVLQNLGLSWLPRWHYAVVVGYDLNLDQIILHTGVMARRRVRMSTFLRTWQRAQSWGLLVLPAGRMPACAREPEYLKAVLGVQQAGRLAMAQKGFQTAVQRWPQSFNAHMGLGNALYINRDLEGAVRSFRAAVALNPGNGDALNNLAHVLAELGDVDEALTMIQKALDTSGQNRATYLETFNEIKRRMDTGKP